ncbi:MAG: TonB-dependent receptor [Proteobacteria bacterium]|nr:TonB-dependent receptor [Pseudomonadota bacterium]
MSASPVCGLYAPSPGTENWGQVTHAKYDFNESVSLQLLAGHYEEAWGFWADYDFTADNSYTAFYSSEIKDTSFEARLLGRALDGRLSWIFGASQVDTKLKSIGEAGVASFYLFPVFFPGGFSTELFESGARTSGIFASADYQLTERFSATLEGRYQEDEIRDDAVNKGLSTPISPATLDSFVPRATLRFKPSDTETLYFTYAEGNLPGGFNASVAALNVGQRAQLEALAPGTGVTYGEETLKNYELGWKQVFAEGRAAFNLATFFMKRQDEIINANQLITDATPGAPNPLATVFFNSNGASTDIYGFEIDGTWNATDNLSLQGSFGYIHAEIVSFPAGAGTGDFGDIYGRAANVEGQRAPRFPPVSGSLSATYKAEMSPRAGFNSWYVRGDAYYTGKFWDSISNVSEAESAGDVNLRFGARGDSLGLEFFVTNLLDEDAPASANNFSDLSFGPRVRPGGLFDFSREGVQMALRDKRQFGVRVNYVFK